MKKSYEKLNPLPVVKLLLFGVVILGLVATPGLIQAQVATPPVEAVGGNSILKDANKAIALPSIALVATALYVIQSGLFYVLGLASYALDNALNFNVTFSPATMPAVNIGWTAVRDISNALFILIILWIALTIIFNIENLGGRKLLVRIIMVALLVNFSLALVTAAFGFTNYLAKTFASNMPRDDKGRLAIGDYIINTTGVHTVFNQLTPQEASDVKTRVTSQEGPPSIDPNEFNESTIGMVGGKPTAHIPTMKENLLASIGIRPAQAQLTGALSGCIAGLFVAFGPWGCVGGALVGAATEVFFKAAAGTFDALANLSIRMFLTSILFLVLIVALLVASVMLLLRLVMMMLLSVLAPAAFLLFALPGSYGKQYWDMWLNSLVKWAFFAPIFYFLLYLALFMLGRYNAGTQSIMGVTNAATDPDRFVGIIIATIFIAAAVMVAKKTSSTVANTTMGLMKTAGTFALGAATGGAGALAAIAARRAAPAIGERVERLSQRPILGKITAPVTRRVTGYLESQKERVVAERKGIEGWSDKNITQEYGRSFTAERKVAAAQILAERGKFNQLSQTQQKQALKLAGGFGPQSSMAILKARPDLATQDLVADATPLPGETAAQAAIRKVAEKLKPDEWAKLSLETVQNLDGTVKDDVIKILVPLLDPEHIKRMARENPVLREAFMKGIELQPQLVTEMKPETYRYLASNAAQEMGLSLPETHTPPVAIQREEIAQQRAEAAQIIAQEGRDAERAEEIIGKRVEKLQALEDDLKILQERATKLDQQNKAAEAEKLRDVDIKRLEADITRLKERLQ